MTQPAPPSYGPTPGIGGVPQPLAVQGLEQYQSAVTSAASAKLDAAAQISKLQQQLAQTPALDTSGVTSVPNPAYAAIQNQIQLQTQAYDRALADYQQAQNNLADAAAKLAQNADPNTQRAAQATADRAQTEAQQAAQQYQEWQAAAPERKAAVAAQQRLTDIQAKQADLQLQFQQATQPAQQQLLQQQIQQNQAQLQQAQQSLDLAKQLAPATVATANAGASKAGTEAEVEKETAPEKVKQAGQTTQLNDLYIQQLLDQIRRAPNDEEAKQAIQLALQQSQASLNQTQAATAGTQASTESTQFDTATKKLGTLAGLDDYISSLKTAIANGTISDPSTADQMLTARLMGTDVYGATQAAENASANRLNAALTQRTQDTGLVSNARSGLASVQNNAFNTVSSNAARAPHGSGAALAGGYNSMVNDFQNRIGGPQAFQPPPQVPVPALPPMLSKFAAQPSGAQGVTINISNASPAAPANNAPSQPAVVQNKQIPTPDDVAKLNPAAAARAGYQGGSGVSGSGYLGGI